MPAALPPVPVSAVTGRVRRPLARNTAVSGDGPAAGAGRGVAVATDARAASVSVSRILMCNVPLEKACFKACTAV